MSKKLINKTLLGHFQNWTAPAGVTSITLTVVDDFNRLVSGCQNAIAGIKRTGVVFTVGSNSSGQLADNSIVNKSSLVATFANSSFTQVVGSGSGAKFHALRADGTLWGWGVNTLGELGDGTIASKSTPVAAVGGHSFLIVSGGSFNGFAIKTDGTIWSWGSNGNGQLGNNNAAIGAVSSPILVAGSGSYVRVSGGENHVVALRTDGSAWSWGQNNNGQLGDGGALQQSSPVAVAGGHSFIDVVAAGASTTTSFGLKADGSVWSWGTNSNGTLGIGSSTPASTSTPMLVTGGHSFIQILGANLGASALKADGSAWSWGTNTSGQLGIGTTSPSTASSPMQVVGGHSFVRLASSNQSTSGLKADGSIWSWGVNSFGQLGDSTTVPKSSPVLMTGVNVFEPGSILVNKVPLEVIPGTTYTPNYFISLFGSQIVRNYNVRNHLVITLEYYA